MRLTSNVLTPAAFLLLLIPFASGCGDSSDDTSDGTTDSGTTDSGTTDSGATDSGTTDSGATDSGITDSGITDSGMTDSGTTDSGVAKDSGTTDSSHDSSVSDSATADSSADSAGTSDAGTGEPTFPFASSFGYPGLRDTQTGAAHVISPSHPVTGKTRSILTYGAIANDNKDDRPAIQAAIDASSAGDEVLLPKGEWHLLSLHPSSGDPTKSSGTVYQLSLKSGVNLRGESQTGAVLISNLNCNINSVNQNQFAIMGSGANSILLSNFTLSSTWAGTYSTDTKTNNPDGGGPAVGINLGGTSTSYCHDISVEHVSVEKYYRMAIRAGASCYDVALRSCTAKNATDVGGGGAGYGFVLQGKTNQDPATGSAPFTNSYQNPFLKSVDDNHHNLIDSCVAEGPYIRHAVLLQYWTHNNLVTNCAIKGTQLDAIDLHGEDEYNNEISQNNITGTVGGAAVGLGNSGATHDKSGANNWIHDNTIAGCLRGVSIQFATGYTVVDHNQIENNTSLSGGYGIGLGYSYNAIILANTIRGNSATNYYALYLFADSSSVATAHQGSPVNNQITGNTVENNAYGILVKDAGQGNKISGNTFAGNSKNNSYP